MTAGYSRSEERAGSLGLRPRARIISQALIGDEPYYYWTGRWPRQSKC